MRTFLLDSIDYTIYNPDRCPMIIQPRYLISLYNRFEIFVLEIAAY